jgi:carbon monoxide dehydrogenase subunit G
MASVRKDISIAAPAAEVWDAIADFYRVHERVAPGFVTDLAAEDGARTVTFSNGMVAREVLVDSDPARRRLAYAIPGGRMSAHMATVQVFEDGIDRSRIVWITDLLPNELADYIAGQMELAAPIMRRALSRAEA